MASILHPHPFFCCSEPFTHLHLIHGLTLCRSVPSNVLHILTIHSHPPLTCFCICPLHPIMSLSFSLSPCCRCLTVTLSSYGCCSILIWLFCSGTDTHMLSPLSWLSIHFSPPLDRYLAWTSTICSVSTSSALNIHPSNHPGRKTGGRHTHQPRTQTSSLALQHKCWPLQVVTWWLPAISTINSLWLYIWVWLARPLELMSSYYFSSADSFAF